MSKQQIEYHILLDNIPRKFLEYSPEKIWQPIKDVIRSNIADRPNDPAEVNLRPGPLGQVACCRIRNGKYAREAFSNLQGYSWREKHLRAWLLEKDPTDGKMYLLDGPTDKTTHQPVPVPVAFNIPASPRMLLSKSDEYGRASAESSPMSSRTSSIIARPAHPAMPPMALHPQAPLRYGPQTVMPLRQAPSTLAIDGNAYHQRVSQIGPYGNALGVYTTTETPTKRYLPSPSRAIAPNMMPGLVSPVGPHDMTLAGSTARISPEMHNNYPMFHDVAYPTHSNSYAFYPTPPSSSSSDNGRSPRQPGFKAAVPSSVLAILDAKSILLKNLDPKTGIKHLKACLERDLHIDRQSFKITPQGKGKGKLSVTLAFRSPATAQEVIRKLPTVSIGGSTVQIVDPVPHPHAPEHEPKSKTEAKSGKGGGEKKEKAKPCGPLIIDGSKKA